MTYQEFRTELKQFIKDRKQERLSKGQLFALRAKFVEDAVKCEKCPRIENLTLDHIVPISILEQLGINMSEDNEENWQVLCRACNVFKGSRLDFTNPKTKELLLKFVSRL